MSAITKVSARGSTQLSPMGQGMVAGYPTTEGAAGSLLIVLWDTL